MDKLKQRLIYIGALAAALIYIFAGRSLCNKNIGIQQNAGSISVAARVVSVDGTQVYSYEASMYEGVETVFTAKIKGGDTVKAGQYADVYDQVHYKTVQNGDRVVLTSYDNGQNWTFAGYDRSLMLIAALAAFFICLIIFGGTKGVNTIIALVLTASFVFAVFIPAVLSNKNIYLWAAMTCFMSIATTMVIVHGPSKKTLSAIIGCMSGVALCGGLMWLMIWLLGISGMVDECSYYLSILDIGFSLDLRAVVFSGVLIGALGAVMDVSISIATALWEIKEKGVHMEKSDYFRSCLNIGRDIMGTMTNTLILAYVGTGFTEVLLLVANNYNVIEFVNRELVVTQLAQSIVGSMGLLFTIPFTGIVCANLFYDKYDFPDEVDPDFMPYVKEKKD